jgi:hypothetical protein
MEEKAVLLVEGRCDKSFFTLLCKQLNLEHVAIKTPKECNRPADAIEQIPKLLPDYLKKLQDGSTEKLGIVVDADYSQQKEGGFKKRWKLLTKPLKEAGYQTELLPVQSYQGSLFSHPDELPNVGLWIMPNHQDDGMLEDFIKDIVEQSKNEQQYKLLQKAICCVKNLSTELKVFGDHRVTKAIIYTWLAWQIEPAQDLVITLQKQKKEVPLIDIESDKIQVFSKWLQKVFSA